MGKRTPSTEFQNFMAGCRKLSPPKCTFFRLFATLRISPPLGYSNTNINQVHAFINANVSLLVLKFDVKSDSFCHAVTDKIWYWKNPYEWNVWLMFFVGNNPFWGALMKKSIWMKCLTNVFLSVTTLFGELLFSIINDSIGSCIESWDPQLVFDTPWQNFTPDCKMLIFSK